jgi:hypothetical protein
MTLKIRRPTQVKKLRTPIVIRSGAARASTSCQVEMNNLLNCWRNNGIDSDACWEKAKAVTECAEAAVGGRFAFALPRDGRDAFC